MIKACLIYYNDADFLPMMLQSLEGKVDSILAVDGKINWFPGPTILSSDGSTEILEEYGATIIGAGRWKDEMQKRSAYLTAANTNDTLLIIDSDELLHGSLPDDHRNCEMLVHSYYQGLKSEWRLRIVKKVAGMRYGDNHWEIIPDPTLKHPYYDACLYHLHFLRPQSRKQDKWIFNMTRQDPIMWRPA